MSQSSKTNRKKKRQKHTTTRQRAIKNGYRSGLEDKTATCIAKSGCIVLFETDKIDYVVPARDAKYTPDFKLPKKGGFFYVETKGIWTVQDRQKHLLIKEQHPDIDIRFVFSNQNAKLYKGSPTTYAAYCKKHGFQYAHKEIPQEWLEEAKKESKRAA